MPSQASPSGKASEVQVHIAGRLPAILPHELVCQVIDAVRHDPQTLRSCSLVSRSWIDYTYRYLFRKVRVTGHWDSSAFVEFLFRLRTPLKPTIGPHIVELSLESEGQQRRIASPRAIVHHGLLAALIFLMPALQTLYLGHVELDSRHYTPESLEIYGELPLPRPLHRLVLDDVLICGAFGDQVRNFLNLFGIFSKLDELRAMDLTWNEVPEWAGDLVQPSIIEHLTKTMNAVSTSVPVQLEVGALQVLKPAYLQGFLFAMLRLCEAAQTLRSLFVQYANSGQPLVLEWFFGKVPLKHITFEILDGHCDDLALPPINRLTTLRSLHFILPSTSVTGENFFTSFNNTLEMLRTMPPSTKTITYEYSKVNYSSEDTIESLAFLKWRELYNIVSTRTPDLTRLVFKFGKGGVESEREVIFVCRALPEFAASGILKFGL